MTLYRYTALTRHTPSRAHSSRFSRPRQISLRQINDDRANRHHWKRDPREKWEQVLGGAVLTNRKYQEQKEAPANEPISTNAFRKERNERCWQRRGGSPEEAAPPGKQPPPPAQQKQH